MYKRLSEVNTQMHDIRQLKNVKGKSVGWDWDVLPYTVKEGCTTYIGAAPASGKTELWFEFLINLSCLHNWNHIIFSPDELKNVLDHRAVVLLRKAALYDQMMSTAISANAF